MSQRIEIYDTTLRDGAQGPGVKFSPDDQLNVVRQLDQLGIRYIEGGQPGSNPKASELFARARDIELRHAQMVAFGSTRHIKSAAEDDANLRALLDAGTNVVTIFGKTSLMHVKDVLKVSLDDNLALISESVAYLVSQGRRVFLDAEHFFDGYCEDASYALAVLESARAAGAEVLVLCETNGGRLPHEVDEMTQAVRRHFPGVSLGIHTHNDGGCAVANTLVAVRAGATQVQGTINGYGERTGNVNLCTVIPNLQLKMGFEVVTPEQLSKLTHVSYVVAELANMTPRDHDPFVGRDAFTHKGGMHADAIGKKKVTYEHIDPALVGNTTHIAVSEVSGRSSLMQKAVEFGIELDRKMPETVQILARIKELENRGYEFEGADASLELIMRKATGRYRHFFLTESFHATVNQLSPDQPVLSEAVVRLQLPNGQKPHTWAEGNGPVDALNLALRKALEETYPELCDVHLKDYKVRIIDGKLATQAATRVLIESSDGVNLWNTVGVSENIITASYLALVDSIEYKLLRSRGHE